MSAEKYLSAAHYLQLQCRAAWPQSNYPDKGESMEEKRLRDVGEINLVDYLIALLKHKKMIAKVNIGVAVVTTIVLLLLPDIYRSDARILPPQSSSISSMLIGQFLGGLSGMAGALGGTANPSDVYVGTIQSRTILDGIIDKFGLMTLYDIDNKVDTREKLLDNIEVSADSKSGIVTISVYDKDPKRAANMANAFVEELKKVNTKTVASEAAQRRLYYEGQVNASRAALSKAEEALKKFQDKTGVLQAEDQVKAVVEGIAALRAQIAAKEVEVGVMRTFSTANNPDLQKAEDALSKLKAEEKKLEVGGGGAHDPLVPTGRMPSLGLEYVRLLRDVKYNEALLELLVKQYELAKMDQGKESTTVSVIDTAIPLDKKDKPKRALWLIAITFVTFLMSVFTAFFIEFKQKFVDNPENRERREMLRKHGDFGVKKIAGAIARKIRKKDH